jgi:hypothetical protein
MNFKQLRRRKRNLEHMLRTANDFPESFEPRTEIIARVLLAIVHEKRGEHAVADDLIRDLDELVKRRQEKAGT